MTKDYWESNKLVKPQEYVVCAACRYGNLILCGARHWDRVMTDQYYLAKNTGAYPGTGKFEQGFINQFGEFLDRREALVTAKLSGQPLDMERNRSDEELYSEGLY